MDSKERVFITSTKHANKLATVLYRGTIDGREGEWLGLELDVPEGNHDGIFNGRRYFQGRENHCIFLQSANTRPFEADAPRSDSRDKGKDEP
jgi:dynactin complex subunit